jgi:hypothetical protein
MEPGLSAKGAKCENLGHRPRGDQSKIFLALKARNGVGRDAITFVSDDGSLFRAFSASKIHLLPPGALPQAFTFRAFGAEAPGSHF